MYLYSSLLTSVTHLQLDLHKRLYLGHFSVSQKILLIFQRLYKQIYQPYKVRQVLTFLGYSWKKTVCISITNKLTCFWQSLNFWENYSQWHYRHILVICLSVCCFQWQCELFMLTFVSIYKNVIAPIEYGIKNGFGTCMCSADLLSLTLPIP